MGERNRRQVSDTDFLKSQTNCIYCGGPPECVEHFPPRAFFRGRVWPEDFRFAACKSCNIGTKDSDLVVSWLAKGSLKSASSQDEWLRLTNAVSNNHPQILREMKESMSRRNQRNMLRKMFGEEAGDELRRNQCGAIQFGPELNRHLFVFGRKLARVLFYKHFEIPALAGKNIMIRQYNLLEEQKITSLLSPLMPKIMTTERNTQSLSDQFAYRYSIDAEKFAIFALARVGEQLRYVIIAFSDEFASASPNNRPGAIEAVRSHFDWKPAGWVDD